MKKLLLLALIFVAISTFGQSGWPGYHSTSSPTTEENVKGMFSANLGLKVYPFADTTAANANTYVKNTPFIIISTSGDGRYWYRNSTATAWTPFASGTLATYYNSNVGSGFRLAIPNTNNIKTITAGNGITLDSSTSNQINITNSMYGTAWLTTGNAGTSTGAGNFAGTLDAASYQIKTNNTLHAFFNYAQNSTAFGSASSATGSSSFAAGIGTATGTGSAAIGSQTTASGQSSTALGGNTLASGVGSFASGTATIMNSEWGTVMGAYNDTTGYYLHNPTSYASTDVIFALGNGNNTPTRSNALQIKRNGAVAWGSGGYGTSGYILQSNGNTTSPTWVAPSSVATNNIYNLDGTISSGDRTVSGVNTNTLYFDNLSGFDVATNTTISLDATNGTKQSRLYITPDSLGFQPRLGQINIDSLRSTSSTTRKNVMMWDSVGGGVYSVPLSTVSPLSGSGTTNYIPKWTPNGTTLGNSQIYDNGTNVGIGTTSPQDLLHLFSSGITGLRIETSVNSNAVASRLILKTPTSQFGWAAEPGAGGTLPNGFGFYDYTANQWRMAVFSTGNVAIGSTTDGGQKLQVTGTANISSTLTVGSLTSTRIPVAGTSGLLGDFANFTYTSGNDAALIVKGTSGGGLRMGSYTSNSTYGAIWSNNVTPSGTNEIVASDGAQTVINSTTNTNLALNGNIGLTIANATGANVGIGTGTSVAASAMLEVTSTTKGFLPPRMTNTQMQAISSPATGLLVFNTDSSTLHGYNGTNWQKYLTANAAGRVGIGTTSPATTLDVNGSATVSTNVTVGNDIILTGFVREGASNYLLYGDGTGTYVGYNGRVDIRSGGGAYTRQYSSGNLGVGSIFTDNGARLSAMATTEQLRLLYDVSNYASQTVSSAGVLTIAPTGASITATKPIVLKNYTVATLPTGVQGMTAFVTDALAPAYLTAIVGGGAIVTPVFYDGTNWVAY